MHHRGRGTGCRSCRRHFQNHRILQRNPGRRYPGKAVAIGRQGGLRVFLYRGTGQGIPSTAPHRIRRGKRRAGRFPSQARSYLRLHGDKGKPNREKTAFFHSCRRAAESRCVGNSHFQDALSCPGKHSAHLVPKRRNVGRGSLRPHGNIPAADFVFTEKGTDHRANGGCLPGSLR